MIYGYIRVSTDKQNVENQRFEIENYCKERGMIVNAWIEETISGTKKIDQRKLGKLLNKLKKDDILICAELSRLGRNMFMIMSILNYCMEKEINKLHKIILDININELSIKRLMKLLPMKNTQELYITMYYSKKLNLFINKVASDFYMLPEYDANLFNKKEYKKIIEGAIIVPRKLYENSENEEEIHQDAIKFCKENNVAFIDDFNE